VVDAEAGPAAVDIVDQDRPPPRQDLAAKAPAASEIVPRPASVDTYNIQPRLGAYQPWTLSRADPKSPSSPDWLPYAGRAETEGEEIRELEGLCEWNLVMESDASTIRMNQRDGGKRGKIEELQAELAALRGDEAEREASEEQRRLRKRASKLAIDRVSLELALDAEGPRRDKVAALYDNLARESQHPTRPKEEVTDAARSLEMHKLMRTKAAATDQLGEAELFSLPVEQRMVDSYVRFNSQVNNHLDLEQAESDARNERYYQLKLDAAKRLRATEEKAAAYYSPRGDRCTITLHK